MRIFMRINKRKFSRFVKVCIWVLVIVSLLIYLSLPLIFQFSPSLQRHFIFENNVAIPKDVNFSDPSEQGLQGAFNHYVHLESGITLGVWQVLPVALLPFVDSESGGEWFLRQLGEGRAVVLYCHGNQPSRATGHRVRLYKVLQGMNLHVVAFDYRGFADSTAVTLSEDGVVDDVIKMAAWVRSWSRSPLYVWGHSLGTGIATKAASQLCLSGDCPEALILQAPFTSIRDQLHAVSLTLPFRVLPWFDASFVAPLLRQGIEFASDRAINDVTCPTLILHAKDDVIVPYSLGLKLYEIARAHLGVKARLSSFEAYLHYGHNGICDAPQLPKIIRSFLRETSDGE